MVSIVTYEECSKRRYRRDGRRQYSLLCICCLHTIFIVQVHRLLLIISKLLSKTNRYQDTSISILDTCESSSINLTKPKIHNFVYERSTYF